MSLLELGEGKWQSHGGIGWAFVPSVLTENQPLVGLYLASRQPAQPMPYDLLHLVSLRQSLVGYVQA
jgi:hypothetical protein